MLHMTRKVFKFVNTFPHFVKGSYVKLWFPFFGWKCENLCKDRAFTTWFFILQKSKRLHLCSKFRIKKLLHKDQIFGWGSFCIRVFELLGNILQCCVLYAFWNPGSLYYLLAQYGLFQKAWKNAVAKNMPLRIPIFKIVFNQILTKFCITMQNYFKDSPWLYVKLPSAIIKHTFKGTLEN